MHVSSFELKINTADIKFRHIMMRLHIYIDI